MAKPTPYYEGEDPVALPHEVQALPGNKFTARILREPGAYYIRVAANHPEFKLRTRVYDPPPYADPRQAVQTAVDFIMAAGDSWHANTPRRGGIFDRVANVHQETSLCVACHPTHFSQRAQLYCGAERIRRARAAAAPVSERALLQQSAAVLRIRKGGRRLGARDFGARECAQPHGGAARPFRDSRSRASIAPPYYDGVNEVPAALLQGPRQAAERRDERQPAAGEHL